MGQARRLAPDPGSACPQRNARQISSPLRRRSFRQSRKRIGPRHGSRPFHVDNTLDTDFNVAARRPGTALYHDGLAI